MSKLEEYTEKTKRTLAILEEKKEEGYPQFFYGLDNYPAVNKSREILFEYILTNVALFFEENGVEYEADVTDYIQSALGYSYPNNIKTLIDGVKNSTEIVNKIAEENNITLEDGMLDYPALLFAISTIPGMRERLTEVFGPELISDEIFPDFTKTQKKLETVTKIATAILEKRKIDSLSDEELIERAIKEDKNIVESNKAVEEITEKLKAIEESIQQNGIYTLENHPTYGKLKEELRVQTEARESAIRSIHETSPSDLRKYIMLSSGIVDYEKMYEEQKAALTREKQLYEEGISAEQAVAREQRKIDAYKEREERKKIKEDDIEHTTNCLSALEGFMHSAEFDEFHRLDEEASEVGRRLDEVQMEVNEAEDKKKKAAESRKKYERLGIFAKRTEEGKKLREDFENEDGLDKKVEDTKKKLASVQAEYDKVSAKRYTAFLDYEELYNALNTDHIISSALGMEYKGRILSAIKKDVFIARQAELTSSLERKEREFKEEFLDTSEKMQIQLQVSTQTIQDIEDMQVQRERREAVDDLFLESLDLAYELTREEPTESDEIQDNVSTHK